VFPYSFQLFSSIPPANLTSFSLFCKHCRESLWNYSCDNKLNPVHAGTTVPGVTPSRGVCSLASIINVPYSEVWYIETMDLFVANWASLQPLYSTIRFTFRISLEAGVELERCLAAEDCKGDTTRVQMPLLGGFQKLLNWYMPFFCVEGRSPPTLGRNYFRLSSVTNCPNWFITGYTKVEADN